MTDRGDTYRSIWRHMMKVPFKQDYVEAAGIRTRYVQAGRADAPTLMLIHGTGGHWETFCANIGPFAEKFNVFALDLFGCGFSDKPDRNYEIADYLQQVIGFMDVMGIKQAAFVGVSLGSWITQKLALLHPERVERMVLIAPAGLLNQEIIVRAIGISKDVETRRESAADPSWDNVKATLGDLFFDKASAIDDLIAVRQQVYRLPGMDAIMSRILGLFAPAVAMRNAISEDDWAKIEAPTLVIENVDVDDLFLLTARAITKLRSTVESFEMQRVCHWAHFEDPDTFNPKAIEFLLRGKA